MTPKLHLAAPKDALSPGVYARQGAPMELVVSTFSKGTDLLLKHFAAGTLTRSELVSALRDLREGLSSLTGAAFTHTSREERAEVTALVSQWCVAFDTMVEELTDVGR